MFVKYFLPEDGDDQNHPNVFRFDSTSPQITLGQIKKSFPIPGIYHFRFLTSVGSTVVWMDVLNDTDVVPLTDGNLIMKVSRIENIIESKINLSNNAYNSNFDVPSPLPTKTENIIDFDIPKLSKPRSLVEDDLLGFSSTETGSIKSGSQSSSSVDLFGLDSIQPTTPVQPFSTPSLPQQPVPAFQTQQSSSNNAYFSMTPPSQPQMSMGNLGQAGRSTTHQRGLSNGIPPMSNLSGGSSLGALDAFSTFNVQSAGRGSSVQGHTGHNSPLNLNANRKF